MKYELMLILKPLLPEEIKSKVIKNIEKLTTESDGSVLSTDVWGKRHLAYPIKKHEEGYYILYEVELSRLKVKEFDRKLALINGVLRFLRVQKDSV